MTTPMYRQAFVYRCCLYFDGEPDKNMGQWNWRKFEDGQEPYYHLPNIVDIHRLTAYVLQHFMDPVSVSRTSLLPLHHCSQRCSLFMFITSRSYPSFINPSRLLRRNACAFSPPTRMASGRSGSSRTTQGNASLLPQFLDRLLTADKFPLVLAV